MIHQRVTIVFQPARGTAADAVNAANQHVFIDLTSGTMTAARTNASGLLVTGTGAGTPVPLDDARDYSVIVLPSAPATPPTTPSGMRLRVSGGRLAVTPHLAIRVTNAAGAAVPSLPCTLNIGGSATTVSTNATGWIISNNQSAGAITLSTAERLLRLSTGTVPAVTLSLPGAPLQRGAAGRVTVMAPAGAVDLRIKRWQCAVSHSNPNGTTGTATIVRPATEAASTFHQFWEGTLCASGVVTARFVTGTTVRTTGGGSVAETVVAMDPQDVTLTVAVNPRAWTTPLTQLPESTFTRTISVVHDTGHHDWTTPSRIAGTPISVGAGPNRGCRFVDSTTGVAFTSSPQINADVVNLSSTFQTAQGTARVTRPPSVAGQVIPTTFYTRSSTGAITITDMAGLFAHLGLPATAQLGFLQTECISAADLLAGVRRHEHLGAISHKQNCLRALRALEPAVYIEAFVETPGSALDFGALLMARMRVVESATLTHNEVDEAATRSSGSLQFVGGSQIQDVNITPTGNRQPIWNPAANSAFP